MDENVRKMQWTDKAGALGPGNAYRAGGAGEESGTGTEGTASAGDGRAKEMQNPTSHDQSFGDAAAHDRDTNGENHRERDAKENDQNS